MPTSAGGWIGSKRWVGSDGMAVVKKNGVVRQGGESNISMFGTPLIFLKGGLYLRPRCNALLYLIAEIDSVNISFIANDSINKNSECPDSVRHLSLS